MAASAVEDFADYEVRLRDYLDHSWERGSNENANGLIRQYLAKSMSMENLTQAACDRIADKLNDRPRKRHDFYSPAEKFLH